MESRQLHDLKGFTLEDTAETAALDQVEAREVTTAAKISAFMQEFAANKQPSLALIVRLQGRL